MHSSSNFSIPCALAGTIQENTDDEFLTDVIQGVANSPKRLASKYFYDQKGSQLFDEICELDEYYPTRTEMGIMEHYIDEMVRYVGADVLLVEYGSGSSLKTRILLENLETMAGYVPIDISEEHLHASADSLRADFPGIEVLPVHADYSTEVELPSSSRPAASRVVYFPGSTIGNFTPEESVDFLKRMVRIVGKGGGVLIGVDLKKDVNVLEAAYNDAKGVTAEFNLNLLTRINTELGADFELDGFTHKAIYNKELGRIEMHLISKQSQTVTIRGNRFEFEKDETIHTENSYKYTLAEFAALAAEAGLDVKRVWTDKDCLFSVQFLKVV